MAENNDFSLERELYENCAEVANTLEDAFVHGKSDDWMKDVLDVDFIVASDGVCRDAKVYFGLGGPTVWVDTAEREVIGCWGMERSNVVLTESVAEWISALCAEEFDAMMVCRYGRRA